MENQVKLGEPSQAAAGSSDVSQGSGRSFGSIAAAAAANLALLALWVALYRPVFDYFAVIFTRVEFRVNQIALAAVAALLVKRLIDGAKHAGARADLTRAAGVAMTGADPAVDPALDSSVAEKSSTPWWAVLATRISTAPRPYPAALALVFGGSLGFLLAERFLDIHTLSALLFALATYGLVGLWMAPARWRAGLPAALLVIGVLPFGAHLETFAGYPLRVLTAQAARGLLAALGFPAVGVDTILVFESGVSQVDIPCSGVKSLWTGALFLLAATWIEERRLGLRWLLAAALTGLLLVFSNFIRVVVLSLVGPALGMPKLAEMLHVPLGVLGFCAACAVGLILLRKLPQPLPPHPAAEARAIPAARPAPWLAPALALAVLAMALLYTPRAAQAQEPPAPLAWSFPAELAAQPAPLTAQELEWIREGGAENAERFSFHWQKAQEAPLSGAFLLLTSQTWRGQHNPERCFQVFGFTVEETTTYLAAPDFPLRLLSLSHPSRPGRWLAAYWLQSPGQITDDYAKRIWADLSPRRERWVLVTVLFDQSEAALPSETGLTSVPPEIVPFFQSLRAAAARSLTEGGVP